LSKLAFYSVVSEFCYDNLRFPTALFVLKLSIRAKSNT